MFKPLHLLLFTILMVANISLIGAAYRHKIEPFSFNVQMFEYPLEYLKMGTAVALRDTIKVIPKVANRYGGVWMSQPVETNMFEVIYQLDIKNDKNTIYQKVGGMQVDDIEGVAIWYVNHPPTENDMSVSFGYRADYNGLGVYMFKHQDQWRILAIYNQGLQGLTVDAAVANLTTADNHCMLPEFIGGEIDIKYTVTHGRLALDYRLGGAEGGRDFKSCIIGKGYPGLKVKGYIGVTSGNPTNQNVNDIDVHSIDFFNMNPEFYQHDAEETVEGQSYQKRDATGFIGQAAYPWSAKLNTIDLGKVAVDVFEGMRSMRDYQKEQFAKSLNIIKKNDDISEVLFKMFEQMRLLNEDLNSHIGIQSQKKKTIRSLEKKLMKKENYEFLITKVQGEYALLSEISRKFSELTREAKKILDNIQAKSQDRKATHGIVNENESHKIDSHHRELPQNMRDKIQKANKDAENLHLSFDKFTHQTQLAVFSLHESQEKILRMRKDVSLSGNTNVFQQFKQQISENKNAIFGKRGKGIYQDQILKDIEERVHQRTVQLDRIIKERIANEQWVSGVLTVVSILCIVILWFKMQKVLNSKKTFSYGGGQAQSQSTGAYGYQNDMI